MVIKRKILKAARENNALTYTSRHTRLASDFSTETWQARKEWHDIFKVLKGKNLQPRIFYPARLSFRIEGEIKSIPHKQKKKESLTTKPAMQEILKRIL
uniref:L1 transposable element dsRBD-like domain-containing protein n=1 Tax=Felis catus TaxID=9685 RepID=A0ABI7X393_FELCA